MDDPAASQPNATPPSPSPQPQPDAPSYTHRRTGFVAQKPKAVRDQINFMILDGVPYRRILQNLGDDGKDLNEDHIRTWAGGGYKDFLVQLERRDALTTTREGAQDILEEKAGAPVQDAGRTVVAAQLYELLLSFNPTSFAAELTQKPELYLRLINALSRLSEGEAVCAHRRIQQSLLAAKLESADDTTPDKKLLTPDELKDIARQIKLLK